MLENVSAADLVSNHLHEPSAMSKETSHNYYQPENNLENHSGNAARAEEAVKNESNLQVEPAGFHWLAGNFDKYSQGIKCDADDVQKILHSNILPKDSNKYLSNLIESGRIKPDQVVISPDHKYVMFGDLAFSKDSIWTTKPIGGFLGFGKHGLMSEIVDKHKPEVLDTVNQTNAVENNVTPQDDPSVLVRDHTKAPASSEVQNPPQEINVNVDNNPLPPNSGDTTNIKIEEPSNPADQTK